MIEKNIYDKLIDIVLKNNSGFKVLYNVFDVNTTTDTIMIIRDNVSKEKYGKYVNNEYILVQLPRRNNVIYDSDVEENIGESSGTHLHIFCNTKGTCSLAADVGISNYNIDSFFYIIDNIIKCELNDYHPHYSIDENREFDTSHIFKKEFMDSESQNYIKKYGEVRMHLMCEYKSFGEMSEIINILSVY